MRELPELAGLEGAPPARDSVDYETWRRGALARCDALQARIRASIANLDRIAAELEELKRRRRPQ